MTGVIIGALGALFGGVWRIREFEKSILAEVESRLETGFNSMKDEINKKADQAVTDTVLENINSGVSRIEASVTTFVARQEARDHEIEARVRNLEIKVSRGENKA